MTAGAQVGGGFLALALLVAMTAAVRGVWSPCGLSMISAINPFTEGARGNRYWLTAIWFIAGSLLGGLLFGLLGAAGAALLSPLTGNASAAAAVAAVCCLVTAASDTGSFGFRLPLHPRQVNERWLDRYRRWVYAAGFGAQIGVGFATYIMTAAVYLTPVLGALSGSPAFAVMLGLLFGAVRGAAVLLSSDADDPAKLRRLHRVLDRCAPWSQRAAVVVQLVAATAFGYAAGGLVAVAVVLTVGAAAARWVPRRAGSRSCELRTTSDPGELSGVAR
jgi:hypothetical protein